MIHRSGIINGKRVHESPLDDPRRMDSATELQYQISSRGCWRPGVYDSERAARYASRFHDEDLQALQDSINAPLPPGYDYDRDVEFREAAMLHAPAITFEMLQELRRRVGDTKPWER